MNEAKCWVCKVLKQKVWNGDVRMRDGNPVGRKIYVEGPNGRQWLGRKCPDCKGGVRKYELNAVTPDPITKRLCRICNKPLPTSRYFNHSTCLPNQIESYGPEDYGYQNYRHISHSVERGNKYLG